MKRKFAVIVEGFAPLYIDFLIEIANKNNIIVDTFNAETYSNINFNDYDYVLSDKIPMEGCVKVFHQHSVKYQINKAQSKIYKLLYSITHKNKIKKSIHLNNSYSKLVCVSNELKKDLEYYYQIPSEKIIVAHAGFVIPEEDNDNKKFKKIKKEETFTICTSAVGFITKGGYTLLKAIKEFHKEYPNIKIQANIIYPKYKKNIGVKLYVKVFKLEKFVKFYDYQKDINKFYANAHCLTCQSIYEAFGRIVTEAMYQKIPVIVGNNIGASDIIKDNINGFLFDSNKNPSKNLARKIKKVYDQYNNLENLVENAYETAKNNSWDNFAKEVFFGLYPEFKK